MSRSRRILFLLAAIVAAGALPPAAQGAPARVVVESCERSLQADGRRAVFEGRMRAADGAERLQMRFTLLQRTSEDRRWRRVDTPGWESWVTSDPGVAGYRFSREVVRLAAPAAYRTVVRFRWLDADGEVLARRRARSRVCRQPDLRPNLRVRKVKVRRGSDPGERRYVVVVVNDGRTRTPFSTLELRVDGEVPTTAAVPAMAPRSVRRVRVEADRCDPDGPGVSVIADAFEDVDERDEEDNLFVRPCQSAR